MRGPTEADTIRVLVATDNHVGYGERDSCRGDDSWKSFHEIMCLAKERDVDMVLLAGDLFHENKPSRKSMYQVMRSLRMNCYGEKPCELEMLSDSTEAFQGCEFFVRFVADITKEIEAWVARTDERVVHEKLEHFDIHFICVPLPSASEFREYFLKVMGVSLDA